MKHFKLFTAAVALTAVFSACSDDETSTANNDGRTALSIQAGISTRAIDNAWQANDAIGVIMLKAGSHTPTENKTNYKYITATTNGAFAPADKSQTAYYPTDNSEVDLMAYYPYSTAITTSSFSLPVDVSKQDNLPAIDLMTADKATGHSTKNAEAELKFSHRLSKLVVTIKKTIADGSMDDVDLSGMTAVLQGTPTTAKYDLINDQITDPGQPTDIALSLSYNATEKKYISTNIVMPTAADAGMKIVLTLKNKQQFIVPFKAGDALVAGTVNLLNITLHRTTASLVATVLPWETGVEASMTIHINTVTVDAALKGDTYTPANGDIIRIGGNALEDATVDYTYNNTTQKWSTETAPYWNYNLTGPFDFYAAVLPATTVGDDEKDYLHGKISDVNFGEDLNFTSMKHLMSKVSVTLIPGDGVTSTDLKNATITWDGISRIDKVNAEEGTITLFPKATEVTFGETTGTNVVRSLLVAPQTLSEKAGTMKLKLGERTYSIPLSALKDNEGNAAGMTQLESGRHYAITVNIANISSDVTLSVTDWTVLPSSLPITIATINTAGNSDNYKPSVGDNLWVCSDEIVVGADEKGNTIRFTYGETNQTGVWTPETATYPVYWLYGKDAYNFQAAVYPKGVLAGGSEKDYLYASLKDLNYGDDLNFKLDHIMGQLVVKLKAGIGYTLADLSNVTLTWADVKELDKVELTSKGYTAKMKTTTKAVTLSKGTATTDHIPFTAIIAPQDLSANAQKLVLAIGNRSYTLDFSKLKTDGDQSTNLTKLEAGKSYTITATLDKNEAKMNLSVAEWITVDGGEGGFDYDN